MTLIGVELSRRMQERLHWCFFPPVGKSRIISDWESGSHGDPRYADTLIRSTNPILDSLWGSPQIWGGVAFHGPIPSRSPGMGVAFRRPPYPPFSVDSSGVSHAV